MEIKNVLFSEQELNQIVVRTAADIDSVLKRDKVNSLTVICVLRGAFVFTADLVRNIDLNDIRIEFVSASSYGGGTVSSGEVHMDFLNDIEIKGKNILVVEDIADTGRTLKKLTEAIKAKEPDNVWVAAMFDKPERRTVEFEPDFIGAKIPDEFIVGYGLDFDGRYRNLPYVAVLGFE